MVRNNLFGRYPLLPVASQPYPGKWSQRITRLIFLRTHFVLEPVRAMVSPFPEGRDLGKG